MLDEVRMTIRLPGSLAEWLRATKEREGSTVNFEIIRSVRERMEKDAASLVKQSAVTGREPGQQSPVTA